MGKIKIVCNRCGSDNVVKDAWAEWDPETQTWGLRTVFDYSICDDCGSEDIIEMPYDPEAG